MCLLVGNYKLKNYASTKILSFYTTYCCCFFLLLLQTFKVFLYFFWPHSTACGILIPWPEIQSVPSASKVQNSNSQTTREVLLRLIFCLGGLFLMWNILKVFVEFVTTPSILCFGFLLQGIQDLSSPARYRTHKPCNGRQSLNLWTVREVSIFKLLKNMILKSYALLSFF